MRLYACVLVAISLLGCAVAPKMSPAQNSLSPDVDFSQIKTYTILHDEPDSRIDQRYYQVLIAVVEDSLQEMGFNPSSEMPDMLVSARMNLSSKTVVVNSSPGLSYSRHTDKPVPVSVTILQGGVVVSLLDPFSGKPLFTGQVKSAIDRSLKTKTKEKQIETAVKKIFKDFPSQ